MLLTMESKTAAHHKLETLITKGRETASTVIDHVMKNQPTHRCSSFGPPVRGHPGLHRDHGRLSRRRRRRDDATADPSQRAGPDGS